MPIKIFLILSLALILYGCLTSTDNKSSTQVIDTDQPPSFQGSANSLLEVGELLYIDLNASDPEGRPLVYTIHNLPNWLQFDPNTGSISGTPTTQDIGLYEDIRVDISDGRNTITAGPFYIQVEIELFDIELTWEEVTQDENNDAINSVAGYNIYLTEPSGRFDSAIVIKNGSKVRHQINRLAPGTYTFTMTAYLSSGLTSDHSTEKQITL